MIKEVFKLFETVKYVFILILKAVLLKNKDSKLLLTHIYTKALYNKNTQPQIHINTDDFSHIILPSSAVNDCQKIARDKMSYSILDEVIALACLTQKYAKNHLFEIGLFKGASLNLFLLNTEASVKLTSLDISMNQLDPQFKKKFTDLSRVEILKQDSLKFDFSPYTNQCDFVFIDGGHTYEIVKKDTYNAFKILKEGGIIVWDDYGKAFPDVFQFLNELSREGFQVKNIQGTSLAVLEYDHKMK